jgi:carbon starvation protein
VTIILKMQLATGENPKFQVPSSKSRPALALIAFIPLAWLLAVTMTAGVQKIWHSNPKIGFLAQAKVLAEKMPALDAAAASARNAGDATAIAAAEKAVRTNRTLQFNCQLDAVVAGTFLVLVAAIFLMSVREWILLLARKKAADLRETPPTWLPDYAMAESKPLAGVALLALAFALVKELSGEAELERAREQACLHVDRATDAQIYVQTTEQRFNGVKRCC